MAVCLHNVKTIIHNRYFFTDFISTRGPEVIITVGHRLKSGQLARPPPISLFSLTISDEQ